MGHYRSEMSCEDEDKKKEERAKITRQEMAASIKKKIDEEGIEFVLADIYEQTKSHPRWYYFPL